MSKKWLFLLGIFLLNPFIFATDPNNHHTSQLSKNARLKLADRYFAESLFYSASENYLEYIAKKPESRYANFWYGVSSYYAKDYKRAESGLKSFYSLSPKKAKCQKRWDDENRNEYKMGKYFYGLTLFRNGKYEEAKKELSSFKSIYTTKDETERATVMRIVNQTLKSCDSVGSIAKAKVKVMALPKGVNHAYSETAPFSRNGGELFFTSTGSDTLMTFKNYKNEKYTAIYKASFNGREWSKGKKIDELINEEKYYTANGTFNKAGNRFYFTKCLERDDERPLCNIFVSDYENEKFGEPKRLPKTINFEEKYTATHPNVRATDNKEVEYVYFVSDRPEGKGGLDIWYTRRNEKGLYEDPQLVEGSINTVADEISPFYDDSTKVLYFASNGHIGFGGFDVYIAEQSTEKSKKWLAPRNMGKPVNSSADDFFFTASKDKTDGYFVSNREGTIPLNGIATASDDIFAWENFKYAVEGNLTIAGLEGKPLEDTKFMLYVKRADGTKDLVGIDSTSKDGTYFFKLNPDADYEVMVERPGLLPVSELITTKGLNDEDTLNQNFKADKDAFVIFGDVIEEGKPEIKLNGSTILVFEILPGGKELLVQEFLTPSETSTYAVKLPTGKDYKIMARKEGYFAGNTRTSTKNLGNTIDSIRADISLKKMQLNVEYKLDNILYEFGKATLTQQSKLILDTLYNIMFENPGIVIELSSHTDSVGSIAGNQRLSQARAQSCVDYLISKGIEKKRMIPMGYGKSKPIAPNSTPEGKDNPEGRALNRRTEFKILKM